MRLHNFHIPSSCRKHQDVACMLENAVDHWDDVQISVSIQHGVDRAEKVKAYEEGPL